MTQTTVRGTRDATGVARRARGFTLIELMVVIVILGALVTLVGPSVWRALFEGTRGTAKAQIGNLSNTVQMYLVSKKSLPRTLEDLTQPGDDGNPFMDRLPSDPWDSPYEYRVVNDRSKEYEIWSNGDDKQPGTEDDILYNSKSGWHDGGPKTN